MTQHDFVIAYLVAGMVYIGLVCRSAWDEVEAEHGPYAVRVFLVAALIVGLGWPIAVAVGIRNHFR